MTNPTEEEIEAALIAWYGLGDVEDKRLQTFTRADSLFMERALLAAARVREKQG